MASYKMSREPSNRKVFIGDLARDARKDEVEDACRKYGRVMDVWLARNPPGFAFVEYEDERDAADAVRDLDGRDICGRRVRVELSSERSRRGRGPKSDSKCYECNQRGHFARECRDRRVNRRDRGYSRDRRSPPSPRRSRSPRRRRDRSPSYRRERSAPRRTPSNGRDRSRSGSKGSGKRHRSPSQQRSKSPSHRGRSYSRSQSVDSARSRGSRDQESKRRRRSPE